MNKEQTIKEHEDVLAILESRLENARDNVARMESTVRAVKAKISNLKGETSST